MPPRYGVARQGVAWRGWARRGRAWRGAARLGKARGSLVGSAQKSTTRKIKYKEVKTMRYITKIHLQNFQSHEDSTFHLAGPGEMTCLSGPSDAGKSSVIRAIDWLYNNNWEPSYIRHGAKTCSVTIHYSDGHAVTIKRPKTGSTSYIITLPTGEKLDPFEGIGRSVPVEVQNLTGVSPVQFGDLSMVLNISKQSSGPFLGSGISGPQRARILGSLSGTEEVDKAVQMLRNALDKNRAEQKRLAGDPEKKTVGEIGILDERIREFDYLESLGQTIGEVSNLLTRVRQDAEARGKFAALHSKFETNLKDVEGIDLAILTHSMIIGHVNPILQILDHDSNLHNDLAQRFVRLAGIRSDLFVQDETLKDTSRIEEAIILNSIADQKFQHKNQLAKLNDTLQSLTTALNQAGKVIALTENNEAAESILQSLETDYMIRQRLFDCSIKINQAHAALSDAESTLDATRQVPEGLSINYCALRDAELYGRLSPLLQRRQGTDRQLFGAEETLKQTTEIKGAEKVLFENQKGMDLLATYFGLQMQRDKVAEAMEAVQVAIKAAEGQVAEQQSGYVAALKEMGVCELCGSEVTEEGLRRVV